MIQNIKKKLLLDAELYTEFASIIPKGVGAKVLWELLVERISNLHGNETASQVMEGLAALKRKSSSKQRVNPDKRTVSAKYEQLRAVRKKKKIERVRYDGIWCNVFVI